MDFNSFERLNHSNVTFGMSHANSIDFNIESQYNVMFGFIEMSYSWIREVVRMRGYQQTSAVHEPKGVRM